MAASYDERAKRELRALRLVRFDLEMGRPSREAISAYNAAMALIDDPKECADRGCHHLATRGDRCAWHRGGPPFPRG